MRIAVLANLQMNAPRYEGMPEDRWHDLDSPKTPNGIMAALRKAGHEAEFFEASIHPPYNLIDRLREYQPDLCFNITESHFGNAREAQIPCLLEMMRIPYTGSSALTLALALDKPMTKRILKYHHLPTPEFQVFESPDDPIDTDLLNEDGGLRWPLFVKPGAEGTSMGVSGESIVHTPEQLYTQVRKQFIRYDEPILVERCIMGREIMIGMVGNIERNGTSRRNEQEVPMEIPAGLTFFPALEVDTSKYDPSEGGVYTNRMKVELADDYHYFCPAPLTDDQLHELHRLAAHVFRVIDCKDVARVDFRLDETQNYQPYILEINPLPGLNPNYSDLCVQALVGGWEHEQIVTTIVEQAAFRHGLLKERVLQAAI